MTESKELSIFAKNLRYYRLANHDKQTDLAEALGVSDKTISAWEGGRSQAKGTQLEIIAERYGVAVKDLVYTDAENNAVIIETQPKQNTDAGSLKYLISTLEALDDDEIRFVLHYCQGRLSG